IWRRILFESPSPPLRGRGQGEGAVQRLYSFSETRRPRRVFQVRLAIPLTPTLSPFGRRGRNQNNGFCFAVGRLTPITFASVGAIARMSISPSFLPLGMPG